MEIDSDTLRLRESEEEVEEAEEADEERDKLKGRSTGTATARSRSRFDIRGRVPFVWSRKSSFSPRIEMGLVPDTRFRKAFKEPALESDKDTGGTLRF